MILVTGATGLVGSALREVLSTGRRPVRELSRHAHPLAGFETEELQPVAADVTDVQAVRQAFEGVEAVVHLAGVAPGSDASHEDRAMATLLNAARQAGVERFIYLSATGADLRSSVAWLRAKGSAEQQLRGSGIPWVILRAGPIFAATSLFWNALAQVVRSCDTLRLPLLCRGALRPVAASDVAIALATALDHHDMAGRSLDVGGPDALSLEQVIDLVAQRLRRTVRIRRGPLTGASLTAALQAAGDFAQPKPDVWVGWFATSEAPGVDEYDRVLPMQRRVLAEELRGFPWGMPPPRAGEPLPVLQPPQGGLPPFIPAAHLREDGDAELPPGAGRVDPYGNPEA